MTYSLDNLPWDLINKILLLLDEGAATDKLHDCKNARAFVSTFRKIRNAAARLTGPDLFNHYYYPRTPTVREELSCPDSVTVSFNRNEIVAILVNSFSHDEIYTLLIDNHIDRKFNTMDLARTIANPDILAMLEPIIIDHTHTLGYRL